MKLCRIQLTGGLLLALATTVHAGSPPPAPTKVFTTISSTVYNGYRRARRADGTFKPESYVFGKGRFGDGRTRDPSIDGYPFLKLARMVAPYLARENYRPTTAPARTDLLIVVQWGTTIPFGRGTYRYALDGLSRAMSGLAASKQMYEGSTLAAEGAGTPAGTTLHGQNAQMQDEIDSALMVVDMETRQREMADARVAALLGYLPEMKRLIWTRDTSFGSLYQDLAAEVEEERYYVILSAFDFRTAWKEKKLKLLWVTRVSIRTHGNRFDRQLAAMLAGAAPYFGRDTPGLVRGFVPEGKVHVGEPKVLEVGPAPAQ